LTLEFLDRVVDRWGLVVVIEISRSAYAQMVGAALDAYPLEACGLIAGPPAAGRGSGRPGAGLLSVREHRRVGAGVHDRPEGPSARRDDADDRDFEINGVVHSHTHSEPYPSPTDVAGPRPVVALRDHQPQA
jgi:[CysO sulfur-carrier protein]-S-L-cysteine hydrolase